MMERISTLREFIEIKKAALQELQTTYGINIDYQSKFFDEFYAISCEHVPYIYENDDSEEYGYDLEALEAVWTIMTLKVKSWHGHLKERYL